jgi:hypothetical protein
MSLRSNLFAATGIVVAVVALSGCAGTKRALGLTKATPDEFAVVSHGPLVMPPDFNLRPPVPGADRPQELPAEEQARSVLVGRQKMEALKAKGMSKGEIALLGKAGADQVPPDVRQALDKESSVFANERTSFTDHLLFWRDAKAPDPNAGLALDPEGEQKRLSENQALGKKANEGKTPVIDKGGRGGFLGVF